MTIDHDLWAYDFVIPFIFDGELYPSGSWLVVYHGDKPYERFPLTSEQMSDFLVGLQDRVKDPT